MCQHAGVGPPVLHTALLQDATYCFLTRGTAALVATNEVEILNDASTLARIAASAAFIHNAAALSASDGGSITATQIPQFIPQIIKEFI